MTALAPDTDQADETQADAGASAVSRLNPLAIAVFALAMLIGGLVIWLSFADAPPSDELVVSLSGGEDQPGTGAETAPRASGPAPSMDGPASSPEAPDTTDRQDNSVFETPAAAGGVQQIGSLEPLPVGASLREAPITGLFEETANGLLPVISANGSRAVASYGRPFTPPAAGGTARPRVAILITGFGLNKTFASRAIEQLPADVSLGFTPYSSELQRQINAARADGHEVALELPMEPFDYPNNDPGPYTLLTSLPEEANRKRLEWLMARGTGYFATVNRQGGRFLSEPDSLTPVLAALKARGVGFIDTGASVRSATDAAVPADGFDWAIGRQTIDAVKSQRQIDKALEDLEDAARKDGVALGIGTALPITVERVAQWAEELDERGVDLVPVSAALIQPAAPKPE